MFVLALDTSTPAVTAGVVALTPDGGTVLAERVTVDPRAHGELLTPLLLEALHEAGLTLAGLDAVVCGVGPGPFTGLRAGLATAAALAHALDIPAHPVCGLDAIAHAVSGDATEPALFAVLTDARRREVYWAAYDAAGQRTAGPLVARPAELGLDGPAAGDGAVLYAETIGVPVLPQRYPAPAGLVAVAAPDLLAHAEPTPLTPLYLRRPDAVEPAARKRVTSR